MVGYTILGGFNISGVGGFNIGGRDRRGHIVMLKRSVVDEVGLACAAAS